MEDKLLNQMEDQLPNKEFDFFTVDLTVFKDAEQGEHKFNHKQFLELAQGLLEVISEYLEGSGFLFAGSVSPKVDEEEEK